MTLIECFTQSHIDNMASCLAMKPKKMILLGNGSEINQHINRYREILAGRKQKTVIEPAAVDETDLHAICLRLIELLAAEGECTIDVTGGDELVLMSVGAVMASLNEESRSKVIIQKLDHKTGIFHNCLHPTEVIECARPEISIKELIRLNGGKMVNLEFQPERNAKLSEVDGIWEILTENTDTWNKSITNLNEIEKRSNFSNEIFLSVPELRQDIRDFDTKYALVAPLLEKMNGPVITNKGNDDQLDYEYKSALMRYCTLKAGNTLEVKTLLTVRHILENGARYFTDSRMSVSIDWDGVTRYNGEAPKGTYNEIDVIAMHGTTPVFISCKNGDIGEPELYKLNTVATYFGGPYAKKILIATNLDLEDKTNRAAVQRARDMGILLIQNAAQMESSEWSKAIYDECKK